MSYNIRKFKSKILGYKLEIIASVCLFSNLYYFLPSILYYIVWIGLFYLIMYKNLYNVTRRVQLVYGLIAVICLSTFINGAFFNLRWILMSVLLYMVLAKTSYDFFVLKERFLYVCLFGFMITGILNYYAHYIGYNSIFLIYNYKNTEGILDFSGYTVNPMWLSAACGLGVIFECYLVIKLLMQKKALAFLFFPIIFLTVQTLVWGALRSALACSIGASILLAWLLNKDKKKRILIIISLLLFAIIVCPVIVNDSVRMQKKQEYQEDVGRTSRDELWAARIVEFESSPILGVGFGVTGIDDNTKIGRAETGSGWLTILSQSGIVGLLLSLALLFKAILPLSVLRSNSRMALHTACLAYLCVHSLFEAYIFQFGWYLCLYFWLTISVLDDSRLYPEYNPI